MSQQGTKKTTVKSLLDFYIQSQKTKVFLRIYAHSQFLCSLARFNLANRSVRKSIQPHTFYAQCSYTTRP